MDNQLVSNIFGIAGAVCWSIQLTPQIILNYRRSSASGLSSGFMLAWILAAVPLGVYNIVSDFNYALWVQPQILASLSLFTWGQCYFYERRWKLRSVLLLVLVVGSLLGGLEGTLIVVLRMKVQSPTDPPMIVMATLAALLLAVGVTEQYIAIYKNRSVEGISFLFCGIDALGDVTSIISVVFEPNLSVLGLVMYGVEFILWCGIFACGFWFKFLPWWKHVKQKRSRRYQNPDEATRAPEGTITLHDLPSSTSVFHLPSHELPSLRSRPIPLNPLNVEASNA